MCEFKVFLNGAKVMEDVVFAKAEGNGIVLKDVIGETRKFDDVKITEVNVAAAKLVIENC